MASKRRIAVGDAFGKFVEKGMRRLTLRIYQTVTVETPVRFGFARAGWTPSTGQPDRSSPTKPASFRDAVVRAQASALFTTHQQAAAVIAAGYKLDQGLVFIVNNVRYIGFLNEGSSAQAPQMFVERAIAIALKATVRELKA